MVCTSKRWQSALSYSFSQLSHISVHIHVHVHVCACLCMCSPVSTFHQPPSSVTSALSSPVIWLLCVRPDLYCVCVCVWCMYTCMCAYAPHVYVHVHCTHECMRVCGWWVSKINFRAC